MGDRKYAVELTVWDKCSGESQELCKCDKYTDALLIKLALEQHIERTKRIERGDNKTISMKFDVEVVPLFEDEG